MRVVLAIPPFLADCIPLKWWMGMQQPSNFALQLRPFHYFWKFIENTAVLICGSCECTSKGCWTSGRPGLRTSTLEFLEEQVWNLIPDNIQTSIHWQQRGKTPSLLLPLMSALHFKGMASPTCHTLVNSLILTRFEVQHQLLCRRTAKCPLVGW